MKGKNIQAPPRKVAPKLWSNHQFVTKLQLISNSSLEKTAEVGYSYIFFSNVLEKMYL